MIRRFGTSGLLLLIVLVAANAALCKEAPIEKQIIEIALKGPLSNPLSEVSGLAWYNDYLIVLPQYPGRIESKYDGKLFAIPKKEILSYLKKIEKNKEVPPIEPREIDFISHDIYKSIDSFEGFEALEFWGNRVFIIIEASPAQMVCYLVKGEITPDLSRITLEKSGKPVKIQAQASISNASYETILVTEDKVTAIFEGNGRNVNVSPLAYVYDHELNFIYAIAFPNIEYRITDATRVENGKFWCINYFWPGETGKYKPAEDPLAKEYGQGKTHAQSKIVERLVEFEYIDMEPEKYKSGDSVKTEYSKIVLTGTPPVQLQLLASGKGNARNWEGIVRLDKRGFLIVSDEHPRTILGFVKSGNARH